MMQRIMSVPIDDHTIKDNMQQQEDHGYIVFKRQNYPFDDDDLLSTVSELTVSTHDRYNAVQRARSNAFQSNPKHVAQCRTCGCMDPSTARCLQVPAPIPIPFFRNPEEDCDRSLKRRRDEAFSENLLENRLAFLKSSDYMLHPSASGQCMKRSCTAQGDLGYQGGGLGPELMTQELSVELIYMEHQALTAALYQRSEYSNLVRNQSDYSPFPALPAMLKVPNPLEPESIPAVIQVCLSPLGLATQSDSDDVSVLDFDDKGASPFEHLSIQPVEAGIDDQFVEKILDIIPSTLPSQPRSIAVLVTPSID